MEKNMQDPQDPMADNKNKPSKLSDLLEKLEEKFPEDEDVLAAVDQYEVEFGQDEEGEDPDAELGLMDEEGLDSSSEPADLDSMLSEDLGDDQLDTDIEMPPKKKKKMPMA